MSWLRIADYLSRAATEGKEILGLVTLRQIHSSLIRESLGKGRAGERDAGGA